MKQFNKKIAMLMAAVMLGTAPLAAAPAIAADSNAKGGGDVVHFSTSFEKGEASPLIGQIEGNKLSNVGEGGGIASLTESYVSLVNTGSVAGSADFHDGESKVKLFDRDSNSKWLNNEGAPSEQAPVWVSFSLNEAKTPNAYMIQSANDAAERDPMTWTVYGSTDGSNWVALDSRKNVYFDGRFESQVFAFENDTAYTNYKLEITANRNNNGLTQFAAFEMGTLNLSSDSAANDAKALDVALGTGPSITWCSMIT